MKYEQPTLIHMGSAFATIMGNPKQGDDQEMPDNKLTTTAYEADE